MHDGFTTSQPIPHSIREVSGDISAGRYETLRVRETIAHLAHEILEGIVGCSGHDVQGGERPVRPDRKNLGRHRTAGQVRLSSPMGAKFVQAMGATHPWDAYWSSTDLGTRASSSRILDEAIVWVMTTSRGRARAVQITRLFSVGPPLRGVPRTPYSHLRLGAMQLDERQRADEKTRELAEKTNGAMEVPDIVEAVGVDSDEEIVGLVKAHSRPATHRCHWRR